MGARFIAVCAGVCAAVCALAFPSAGLGAEPAKTTLTVFAAASLTNVLQDLGDAYTRETSVAVKFSFAASSTLARQIEQGAPADIFMSADAQWMNYLQSKQLIQAASRRDVVGNRLVLIAPLDSNVKLKIAPNFPLAEALGNGHLATGDPAAVPVGRYAQAALTRLGVWNQVSDRLVRAESVRSALAFVDRGEAPLGIVYQTDALVDRNVRIVDAFPADSHPPIVYPLALTLKAQPGATAFAAFIAGPAARATFKSYGFLPPH
jgi:molybdate transport system substrate-binding protein